MLRLLPRPARRFTLAAPAALLVVGCSTGERHAAVAGERAAPPAAAVLGGAAAADTAPWTARRVAREEGRCDDAARRGAPGAAPCTIVRISWPEIAATPHPALGDSARRFVREAALAPVADELPSPNAEAVAETFLAVRAEAARTDSTDVSGWLLEREVTVACNEPAVLSLRAHEVQYSGGAHGMQTVRLASFDARTGRRLTLADILGDSATATRAAERRFREQRDIRPGQPLADAGFVFFENDRFALTENFHICGDTVTFRYDPYEIAPYALGPTELVVPVAALR